MMMQKGKSNAPAFLQVIVEMQKHRAKGRVLGGVNGRLAETCAYLAR